MAKLSSSVEDVRFKVHYLLVFIYLDILYHYQVVSQTKMIYHLTQSLQSDVPDIKMAATN